MGAANNDWPLSGTESDRLKFCFGSEAADETYLELGYLYAFGHPLLTTDGNRG